MRYGFRYAAAAMAMAAGTALMLFPGPADAQPRSYIVVLDENAGQPGDVALDHSRRHGLTVSHVYENALRGYSATIPDQNSVKALAADARVAYMEPDGVMNVNTGTSGKGGGQAAPKPPQVLPWGIDRIDTDLSSTLAGDGVGVLAGIRAYVIDTGIAGHSDLSLAGHVNFAGGKNSDCNGHGTHVAGTVAARDNTIDVVGAAPGAPLIGVKVLGCGGTGSTSGVIAGVDWVTANAVLPAVANLSLGGGASQALDEAVARSAGAGVLYAVAAGNEGTDACTTSPARAGAGTANGIVTVAATDSTNAEASWSNFGPCVDIWAPGVGILSTKRGGGTTTMSGTSMASPHVAGTGALLLAANAGTSAANIESRLVADSLATGTTSKDSRSISLLSAKLY